MKHNVPITIWLVALFILSQIIGIVIISGYTTLETVEVIDSETNETIYEVQPVPQDLPNNMERPEFDTSAGFIVYLIVAVIIATILFMFLAKLRTALLWKLWFFFAVFLCLTIAFGAFTNAVIATTAALIFGIIKVFKPNIIVQNITEVFLYGGLAAIFVPMSIVTVSTATLLLILISIYDAYAVWKSKHMIKIAKFQAESKVFAGLMIPYKKVNRLSKPKKQSTEGKVKFKGIKTAILGGGDIAFPLIFSGTVFKSLLTTSTAAAWTAAIIITITTTIALIGIFTLGKSNKFYPAMPFLSLGCFIGYGIVLLL